LQTLEIHLRHQRASSAPINESSMKIVKQIFRRPNAKRQAKAEADEKAKLPVHVKTIKKKALLIGVKDIREEVKGVKGGVKPPQRGPVTQIKSRLKVASRKTNKLQSLKGPHRDVRVMRDLLISELDLFFINTSLGLTSLDKTPTNTHRVILWFLSTTTIHAIPSSNPRGTIL
jgi:hypothetical protein